MLIKRSKDMVLHFYDEEPRSGNGNGGRYLQHGGPYLQVLPMSPSFLRAAATTGPGRSWPQKFISGCLWGQYTVLLWGTSRSRGGNRNITHTHTVILKSVNEQAGGHSIQNIVPAWNLKDFTSDSLRGYLPSNSSISNAGHSCFPQPPHHPFSWQSWLQSQDL